MLTRFDLLFLINGNDMELTTPREMFLPDQLLSGMADGHILLDKKGYIQGMDKKAARLLGYDASALIGYAPAIWWSDGEALCALWQEQRQPESIITTLRQSNGTSLSVLMGIMPLKTGDEYAYLLSIATLKQADHLNDAFAHLQRLAGIGTLTSSVTHELTNPISIIASTCSNLLLDITAGDNTLSRETLLQYVKQIEQSANRCVRIMEVLRNYSLYDELQTAVTDLNLIIEDGLTLLQHQFIREYNVQIEMELADDLKSIMCDHSRMTQVFINLLLNARDAMLPSGGTITIKSWAIELASKNGQMDEELYAFSVQDRGTGIQRQHMDQIFDLFFTTKQDGTGLGLFMAQRIVQHHNGRIWATNNEGEGCTFTVTLPRHL